MKTLKFILFVVLCLAAAIGNTAKAQYTQQWTAVYDNQTTDEVLNSTKDAAGNIYITGSTYNGVGRDILTVKYNSAGAEQWVARYTTPGNNANEGAAITVDGAGNVYVTGQAGNPSQIIAIKYNSAGVQQWVTSHNGSNQGGNSGRTIKVDNSGNVYVGGKVYTPVTFTDFIAIKFNPMGVIEWAATYNSPNIQEAFEMEMDASGNIYICGKANVTSGYDMLLVKWNSSGIQQWAQLYDAGNDDEARGIALDNSGNIYITGFGASITTAKYNPAGVQQWVSTYTGVLNGADEAYDIVTDAAGNSYITGYTYTSSMSGSANMLTIKYNSAGVQQWASTYNGPAELDDEGWTIATDGAGNVYTGGLSRGIGTHDDFTIVKYNASGVQQWSFRTNGTGNSLDLCRKVLVDSQQNIYAAGTLFGTTQDCYVYKFSALTGIQQNTGEIPSSYSLSQNYPNPFNPITNFEFKITDFGFVTLKVYNSQGKEVRTVVKGNLSAGSYKYSFDGTGLNSGIYFYRLEAGEFTETRKMMLVK